jgi:hypothetical protein
MPTRVSLAELIDSDVPLRPDEAVAIVREVCRQHAEGTLRGIPNATVIRLTPDGRIVIEGPVNRDLDPISAAAALLTDLLPGFHSPTGFKVPGGLRLVLARATRTLDLPPFADVAEFCASLERFATADLAVTVRHLFTSWSSRRAVAAAPGHELTISDVRRARRATGVSLEEIAQAIAIPATRLRELEWGYLRNWPSDERGRDDLRRYARAAAVDEEVVLAVAWPLVESSACEPVVESGPMAPVVAPARDDHEWALVPAAAGAARPLQWRARSTESFLASHRWLLALAAAVVLVIAVLAISWERAAQPLPVVEGRREPIAETGPVATAGSEPPAITARTAVAGKAPAAHPRATKAKPRSAAQPQQQPQAQPRRSFFKRELFRIVIK